MDEIKPGSNKSYLKTSIFETWKSRIPWLMILMLSSTFTGKIIESYEQALTSYVILTAFMPMLMGSAGNAGGQASVTIIRGLSLGDIEFKDIGKVIWKELRVALLCGLTLASINMVKVLVIDKVTFEVAIVINLTLLVTVIISKLIGCTLPILVKKIHLDPAVMASPIITTIIDALSLVIYFQIATHLLSL